MTRHAPAWYTVNGVISWLADILNFADQRGNAGIRIGKGARIEETLDDSPLASDRISNKLVIGDTNQIHRNRLAGENNSGLRLDFIRHNDIAIGVKKLNPVSNCLARIVYLHGNMKCAHIAEVLL